MPWGRMFVWNKIRDGFKQYPSETSEAVWQILVETGIAGGAALILLGVLIVAYAMWRAR